MTNMFGPPVKCDCLCGCPAMHDPMYPSCTHCWVYHNCAKGTIWMKVKKLFSRLTKKEKGTN